MGPMGPKKEPFHQGSGVFGSRLTVSFETVSVDGLPPFAACATVFNGSKELLQPAIPLRLAVLCIAASIANLLKRGGYSASEDTRTLRNWFLA